MSSCDAYKDCTIRIMPDCHAGSGCTIGTVIKLKDKIVPNTVGVDVGCGMFVAELGNVDVDLNKLDEIINTYVPSGFNIHERALTDLEELSMLHCKDAIDFDIANRSIGSLGGGNHFIELNVDESGDKYLVIHSGSRNLGVRICKYYQDIAIKRNDTKAIAVNEVISRLKSEGRERYIQKELQSLKVPSFNKDLAYLLGEDAKKYMGDMLIAQYYASVNRFYIADIILQKMDLEYISCFQTIHNYIELSSNILRKGAVSARKGEKLIIPINMRDGSLICIGKGNAGWLNSAPHGAGRLMSRKKAKQSITLDEFEKSMSGIYSSSICQNTIDESPMAYKSMDEIMECISDTVEVVNVIKPIYNFKAKD